MPEQRSEQSVSGSGKGWESAVQHVPGQDIVLYGTVSWYGTVSLYGTVSWYGDCLLYGGNAWSNLVVLSVWIVNRQWCGAE